MSWNCVTAVSWHSSVVIVLLSCDSIEKLRKKCENSAMEKELKEPPKFKDFYQFTFNFAKNPGQKGLGGFSY